MTEIKQRRRGAELEAALLEAAWAELLEHGYTTLTLEGIAARAGTSRTVVARRFREKSELAIAAIRHELEKHPLEVPATGNVRAELLELLSQASARATTLAVSVMVAFGELTRATGETPSTLRSLLTGDKDALAEILARGVQNGQLDKKGLKPAVATLLSDLWRHYVLMNHAAPPPALCRSWVDDIFLPLVGNK